MNRELRIRETIKCIKFYSDKLRNNKINNYDKNEISKEISYLIEVLEGRLCFDDFHRFICLNQSKPKPIGSK